MVSTTVYISTCFKQHIFWGRKLPDFSFNVSFRIIKSDSIQPFLRLRDLWEVATNRLQACLWMAVDGWCGWHFAVEKNRGPMGFVACGPFWQMAIDGWMTVFWVFVFFLLFWVCIFFLFVFRVFLFFWKWWVEDFVCVCFSFKESQMESDGVGDFSENMLNITTWKAMSCKHQMANDQVTLAKLSNHQQ